MLNKYTVIYGERQGGHVIRKDVMAKDEQEAVRQLVGQIFHVIKHEPIDHSEPAVRFLDRCLPGDNRAFAASEGCHLIVIDCTPTTDLDVVRHELWHQVLKVLDLGDVSQCDQFLLDDALNDADMGGDHPFRLDEWPYDQTRYEIVELIDQLWIAIDWRNHNWKTFDCQGGVLAWITPPYEKATLLFEVWPGRE